MAQGAEEIGEKPTARRQHVCDKKKVEAQIEHGQRAIAYMVWRSGYLH